MRRILLGTLFAAASFNAFADVPGGVGCGWGNMLFKGQRSVATHMVATTTNGTSGGNTLDTTTGTNGCHTNGTPSYGGKPPLVLGSTMDELFEDMAKSNGKALTTCAVVLGVQPRGREHFTTVTHEYFSEIFNKPNATAIDVYANTQAILKQDARLVKYTERA